MTGQHRPVTEELGVTPVTVSANGTRIHLVSAGEGPLVLLLHGFPESWYSWRHQLTVLRDAGFRALAMSGRGYGRSAKPSEIADYRVTELVADCVGVVHALGEQTAVIAGHDWGAQVAWTAAWTRPDVFRAVAGLSVPFDGRRLTGLPCPGADRRPSEVGRAIADPDLTFYMDYVTAPGIAEREIEADVRTWLRDGYYSYSGSPPTPPELAGGDPLALSDDVVTGFLRGSAACLSPGARWRDKFLTAPDVLPDWISERDMDFYVAELEYSGLTGPLNWYRCLDLDWELLAEFADRPVEVPALYVAGARDPVTVWSKDAIKRMSATVPKLHATHVFPGCGHWVGEERPDQTNAALLDFLSTLPPV